MRLVIVIFLSLFIIGCQGPSNTPAPTEQRNSLRKKTLTNQEIYNRYKNKNNRYTVKQDHAPLKPINVSFKEPVPTSEPLSRYGNPTEYHVDGHKYEVMKSSSGYKTRGVASWYGSKFHKQRTSSGEPYDMYVMTAAHKTLPLPTYIRVRNLDNGKTAVVKVNDRGPFHADRIIDLSYAAALKLGVFPKGTAHVEIETLKGPAGEAHYYLQAGAFSSQYLATRLKDKLIHISTSPVFIEHYKEHYVVRVGPFGTKKMADNLKTQLTHHGVTGSFSVLI